MHMDIAAFCADAVEVLNAIALSMHVYCRLLRQALLQHKQLPLALPSYF